MSENLDWDDKQVLENSHEILHELNSSKNSLELTAQVAVAARNEELAALLQSIASKYCPSVSIELNGLSTKLTSCIPDISLVVGIGAYKNIRISISFISNYPDGLVASISTNGLDCYSHTIHNENASAMISAQRFILDLEESLIKIEELVNSEAFKNYAYDISQYENAENNIENFKKKHKMLRIQEIADSLSEHAIAIESQYYVRYNISKITKKRVYLDDRYAREHCHHKTIDRISLAHYIFNGNYKLITAS